MKPSIGKRIAIFVVLLSISGSLWYVLSGRPQETPFLGASGTVEATEIQLGFPAAGRIDSIYVREGDRTGIGMTLASLDRSEILARKGQAEAQVAASRALLLEMERGFQQEEIAQAASARNATRQRMEDARRDLDRTKQLFEGGAVSREMQDKAQTAFEVATSLHTQAEEQLTLLEKGPRRERIAAQRAQIEQAAAAVRMIDARMDQMTIVSRTDGLVTIRHREPDEIVAPGSPVLTIMNQDDRWVRIFIREDRIGAVHIGQKATITADTYPDRTYGGEVTFIAREAEFTPKNVQTTEERVKLVYAVKVRITDETSYDLKPGMPADVALSER